MLQNTSKTLGFQKIMVYKTPPGGGGKPYLARGLLVSLTISNRKTSYRPFLKANSRLDKLSVDNRSSFSNSHTCSSAATANWCGAITDPNLPLCYYSLFLKNFN